ncbi:MAG: DUF3014 domain-containing protein [Xanthomonadales bacterium]|nr:DUF3014 domain-containing protein [Xanthomonadales bacterium]
MSKLLGWLIVIAVVGLAAWYVLDRQEQEEPVAADPAPETSSTESPQPEPQFPVAADTPDSQRPVSPPLPPLDESDTPVAEALAALVGAERLGSVAVLDQVVRRMVATVDALDARELPPLVMPVQAPEGEFQVHGEDAKTIAPENSLRYQRYVELLESLGPAEAAAFYRRHYPLFQQAYSELGYGDAYFNDRVVEIIEHLLATPQPEQPPQLEQVEAVYVFSNPEYEALSAGQKILLRASPGQRARIEEVLEALHGELTRPSP